MRVSINLLCVDLVLRLIISKQIKWWIYTQTRLRFLSGYIGLKRPKNLNFLVLVESLTVTFLPSVLPAFSISSIKSEIKNVKNIVGDNSNPCEKLIYKWLGGRCSLSFPTMPFEI